MVKNPENDNLTLNSKKKGKTCRKCKKVFPENLKFFNKEHKLSATCKECCRPEKTKKKINSRDKGVNGELDALQALEPLGIGGHRSQQYSGADGDADLALNPPYGWLHVEVKRRENFNVYECLEQAEEDCTDPSKTPVVLHRRSRKGWIAILSLADFVALVKERNNE